MKNWFTLAIGAALLVTAAMFLRHDLRGWTPANPDDPATLVTPVDAGDEAFTIGQCLPGTIRPHESPSAAEYQGNATMTVLTCRSRASALHALIAYLVVIGGAFILQRRRAARERP